MDELVQEIGIGDVFIVRGDFFPTWPLKEMATTEHMKVRVLEKRMIKGIHFDVVFDLPWEGGTTPCGVLEFWKLPFKKLCNLLYLVSSCSLYTNHCPLTRNFMSTWLFKWLIALKPVIEYVYVLTWWFVSSFVLWLWCDYSWIVSFLQVFGNLLPILYWGLFFKLLEFYFKEDKRNIFSCELCNDQKLYYLNAFFPYILRSFVLSFY